MNINLYFAICKKYHKFNIKRYKLKFINYYRIISPPAKDRFYIIQIRDNLHKFIKSYPIRGYPPKAGLIGISISYWYKIITNIVKIFIKRYNLQITNSRFKSYLVGISETTRETSLKNKNIKFNEWLAGIIDANGNLTITKNNIISLEIIISYNDIKALEIIKSKYGGSIKPKSGYNTFRYRLSNLNNIIIIINNINGNLHNSKRLLQLHKICNNLNIPLIESISLNKPRVTEISRGGHYKSDQMEISIYNDNNWYIGYFDGKGKIEYKFNKSQELDEYIPELTISINDKILDNINIFKSKFGGSIYYNKGSGGSYTWCINNKLEILNYYNYIKINPSRTSKFNKLILIKKYYELIEIKAYKSLEGSSLNKIWLNFERKWNS